MAPLQLSIAAFLLSSTLLAQASVTQKDFTGYGNIFVLNSSDWRTAKPKDKVGCLDDNGRFISKKTGDACGTFARLNDYPYTISSKEGNCTFTDQNTETNSDSYYGATDHAWTCNATYSAIIYDELYTIDGFPYPFICNGDVDCYYDAKAVPADNQTGSLWPFRWGSMQQGITPGHVMLLLVWNKLGDLPKREREAIIPSPRVEIKEGMQISLQGPRNMS